MSGRRFCFNCSNDLGENDKFCTTCGANQLDNPPTSEERSQGLYTEPFNETAYMQGGYKDRTETYPRHYFNLDNLFKGTGNLIRHNILDAMTVYIIYIAIVGGIAFYFTRWLIPIVTAFIEFYIPESETGIREFVQSEEWGLVYFSIVLFITNIFVSFSRWLPDILFYRRLIRHENGLEESWTSSIGASLRVVFKYFLTSIILLVLRILIVLFMVSPIIFLFVSQEPEYQFLGMLVFTMIAGAIVLFILDLKLYVVLPSVAMLGEGPFEAIRNSWRRTSNNLMNIFLINLGLSIATGIVQSIVSRLALPFAFFTSEIVAFGIASILGLAISLPAQPLIRSAVLFFTQLYHGEKQQSQSFKLRTSYY